MEPANQKLDMMSTLRKSDMMSTSTDMSPRSSTEDKRALKADEVRQHWLDQMPTHWRTPEKAWERHTLSSLASGALGQPDLTELWFSCRDEKSFQVYRDRLMRRITTITIVGALLVIPLVVLVSTTAPRAEIINYNIRGPHIMFFNAFATMFVTVIVGLGILHTFSDMKRESFIQTSMRTRTNVYCFLVLMGSPFQQVCISSIIAAIGLLAAAFSSHDKIIKGGAIFNVLLPSMPLFVYFGAAWYTGDRAGRAQSVSPAVSIEVIEVEPTLSGKAEV